MKNLFNLFCILFIFFSCGPREKVSREVFDQVNKSMEVKKLNEADIIKEAMLLGEEISSKAQGELMTALQKAISEHGVTGAISFCNLNALPILAEVSDQYGVEIRRVSEDFRNPEDQPRPDEKEILSAYTYNTEKGFANEPNIQKIQNGEVLLYTKAIVIPNNLCLNCHGELGKDIDSETAAALEKLYPEDKATGHKIGDLRGIWSLRIPKKEVVNRM
jgi:hypothetical protein